MASKSPFLSVDDEQLLDRFEAHSAGQGYSTHTVANDVPAMRHFLAYLQRRRIGPDAATPTVVAAFLKIRMGKFQRRYGRAPKNADWSRQYTNPIDRFLRLVQEQWPPPPAPCCGPERFRKDTVEAYGRWLIEVRGLSDASRVKNCRLARTLLDWLDVADRQSLARITVADIDKFLTWRLSALRRATRSNQCVCLRGFLRYLFWGKLLQRDLSITVRGPVVYQHAEIPRAFTEHQIKAILDATRADRSAKGLRDYAMLLLLATYGLRAGEVIRLRLTDVDWRGEALHVQRSKTGTESKLPLVAPVAQALLKYLQRGRPKTEFPELFLRSRAPLRPLSHVSALNGIINGRIKEAGITVVGRHGSHAFRFARAMSLLRAAVTMKSIGDLLGHSTTASTEVYLRLDSDDLRSISLDLPGKDHHAPLAKKS